MTSNKLDINNILIHHYYYWLQNSLEYSTAFIWRTKLFLNWVSTLIALVKLNEPPNYASFECSQLKIVTDTEQKL